MKKFLNRNFIINIILTAVFGAVIFIVFYFKFIKIEASINALFPNDKQLTLSANISKESPLAQKVIFYLEVDDENNLIKSIEILKKTIDESDINFTNAIPSTDDVLKLLEYSENNSLLLYPYETAKNPFTGDEIKKRLNNKFNYLNSMPLFTLNDSFFYDPLMMSLELLNQLKETSSNKYASSYGGIIPEDRKSFMLIYNIDLKNEDYNKIKKLKQLDKKILNIGKDNKFKAFIFCSHLYFLESQSRIIIDTTIIFILQTIFVFLIFYIFFKNFTLIFYTAMPILGGYAFTFLILALIKPKFGGIALAFSSSVIGLTIDYIVHYLSKRNHYATLSDTRKKIGLSLFLGVLTTVAAFALLVFGKIELLNEIALFGFISIISVYLISWFVMQPLVTPDQNKENHKLVFKIPFINNKLLFYIWLVMTLLLSALLPLYRFEYNINSLDMNHKELEARKKIIMEKFKESNDNIFLTFTGENRDLMIDKSLYALNIIKNENPELTFISPALLMPSKKIMDQRKKFIKENFNKNLFMKNLEISEFTNNSFDKWLNNIEKIDDFTVSSMPEFIKNQYDSMFVMIDDKEYLIIHIYKRANARAIKEILDNHKIDFKIVDIVEDSKNGLITFEKKALVLLLISLIVIFLILIASFKNFIYAFTSLLPGLTGLLACLVISFFTNNGFNIMHFVSSTLIIGVCVDYGIFITIAYKNKFSDEEYYFTLQSILICALTTIAGFGILALSSNNSLFSIGSSMFGGIAMALMTTYYGIPYILKKYLKK